MKIIGQLAMWMLNTNRISEGRYYDICNRILGEPLTLEQAAKIASPEDEKAEREAVEDAWWKLRGAGVRHDLKEAGKRKGGRPKVPNKKSVKVWELEPKLPEVLMGDEAAFGLPSLLWPVAAEAGRRFSRDWRGFADCVAFLYGLDAERLHDSFRAAVIRHHKLIPPLLIALEDGDSLFPADFLSDYAGKSVGIIRNRLAGEADVLVHGKTDWILRYSNFNTINEACLVRNRLHRVFRLWVRHGATLHDDCRVTPGRFCLHLNFGERIVHFPLRPTTLKEILLGTGLGRFLCGDGPDAIGISGRVTGRLGGRTLAERESRKTVTIPYGVTSIEDGAFEGCRGLKSVTIPGSVTSIGERAFAGCEGLESVTIMNGVTRIGARAFYGCRELASVTISNDVTSIEDGAFEDCSGLKSLTIPNGVTSIGEEAFGFCWELESVTIPSSVKSVLMAAFFGCDRIRTVYADAGDGERVRKLLADADADVQAARIVER